MILHLESVMKVRGSIIVIRAKLTSIWCPKSHWVLYFKAYVDDEIYQRMDRVFKFSVTQDLSAVIISLA